MRVECSICNKDFANKNSLYQHRNKYHQSMDKNLNEEKVLVPNPTFMDINRKRSHSSDSSRESDSNNNAKAVGVAFDSSNREIAGLNPGHTHKRYSIAGVA